MTFSTLASLGVSLQGGGGSGGTPGGSNTQIQYNNSGAFAGASGLTTNGTELTIASGTKTADAPVLNMSQTWNNGAVTFTGLKFNVVSDTSAAASLLMDLQVGGSSRFSVNKLGLFSAAASIALNTGYNIVIWNLAQFGWGSSGTVNTSTSLDTILTRRGAANLRFGAADAAAPVAQTLSVQSVVAGTSNTAGANLTITGSQGTGTGAGGAIIFQVAPAGSPGTVQNALETALTINADRSTTFASVVNFGGNTQINSSGTYQAGGTGTPSCALASTGLFISSAEAVKWSSTASWNGSLDLFLLRDAANTLALRNGAAAQAFNLYGTYTSSTSYERLAFTYTASNDYVIRVEKGSAAGSNRSLTVETYGNATSTFESETLKLKNDGRFAWSSSSASRGSVDTAIHRIDAGIVGIRGSSSSTGAALSLIEQTAPAAPAANGVRIYAEDDGAGKTRLMARFATGAAVQIAIEP